MTETMHAEGALERAVGSLSRGLAQRVTRRSAVARLGRYGIALSMGAAGLTLLDEPAWADDIPGCNNCLTPPAPCGRCADSDWCGQGGQCLPGTCECGGWTFSCRCTSGGASGCWWYGDCCNQCGGGNCGCGPNGPTCCNELFWHRSVSGNGWRAAPGTCRTCNAGSPNYIRCRRKYCNTSSSNLCTSPASCCPNCDFAPTN